MTVNVLWIQSGGCGGDTMSFLCADDPGIDELFTAIDGRLLWHPSLSNLSPTEARAVLDSVLAEETPLDVLIVEGAIVFGPNGTGAFDMKDGRPKKDWVADLARVARYVVAAGTCAAFGGFGRGDEIDSHGLQFTGATPGGLLPPEFRSRGGLPVLNLSGCPVHPAALSSALTSLAFGAAIELDNFQRPADWYGTLVHQGCTRNEYHEFRVEEREFGQNGCLFFYMGCHGPVTGASCNKTLWNERSSKTRAGIPCFSCTEPYFPKRAPFFETKNVEGVPVQLPRGVDRAHYLAYKGMAAAAAPQRLLERKGKV